MVGGPCQQISLLPHKWALSLQGGVPSVHLEWVRGDIVNWQKCLCNECEQKVTKVESLVRLVPFFGLKVFFLRV